MGECMFSADTKFSESHFSEKYRFEEASHCSIKLGTTANNDNHLVWDGQSNLCTSVLRNYWNCTYRLCLILLLILLRQNNLKMFLANFSQHCGSVLHALLRQRCKERHMQFITRKTIPGNVSFILLDTELWEPIIVEHH